MRKIRVVIAGVGNCASSLVQGLEYYRGRNEEAFAGLMHARIGDWGASDIEIVAAFDIDRRKVGKRVEEAIFAKPNCTKVFQSALPVSGVVVQMGPVLDGVAPHMANGAPDQNYAGAVFGIGQRCSAANPVAAASHHNSFVFEQVFRRSVALGGVKN